MISIICWVKFSSFSRIPKDIWNKIKYVRNWHVKWYLGTCISRIWIRFKSNKHSLFIIPELNRQLLLIWICSEQFVFFHINLYTCTVEVYYLLLSCFPICLYWFAHPSSNCHITALWPENAWPTFRFGYQISPTKNTTLWARKRSNTTQYLYR
jgi:hypothetical protein